MLPDELPPPELLLLDEPPLDELLPADEPDVLPLPVEPPDDEVLPPDVLPPDSLPPVDCHETASVAAGAGDTDAAGVMTGRVAVAAAVSEGSSVERTTFPSSLFLNV